MMRPHGSHYRSNWREVSDSGSQLWQFISSSRVGISDAVDKDRKHVQASGPSGSSGLGGELVAPPPRQQYNSESPSLSQQSWQPKASLANPHPSGGQSTLGSAVSPLSSVVSPRPAVLLPPSGDIFLPNFPHSSFLEAKSSRVHVDSEQAV